MDVLLKKSYLKMVSMFLCRKFLDGVLMGFGGESTHPTFFGKAHPLNKKEKTYLVGVQPPPACDPLLGPDFFDWENVHLYVYIYIFILLV